MDTAKPMEGVFNLLPDMFASPAQMYYITY